VNVVNNNLFSSRHRSATWTLIFNSPGGNTCVRVCRWVKWTSMVVCYIHSLTSCGLVTCHWTVKVTCWSLTGPEIAFNCWAVIYNYNASSLTQTLKSSCGCQHDYVTTNSHHNSTLHTAVWSNHLTSSQCSVCDCDSSLLATLTLTSLEHCFNIHLMSSLNPLIHHIWLTINCTTWIHYCATVVMVSYSV